MSRSRYEKLLQEVASNAARHCDFATYVIKENGVFEYTPVSGVFNNGFWDRIESHLGHEIEPDEIHGFLGEGLTKLPCTEVTDHGNIMFCSDEQADDIVCDLNRVFDTWYGNGIQAITLEECCDYIVTPTRVIDLIGIKL